MTNFSGMKSLSRTFVVFLVLASVIILPVQSFSQEDDQSTEPELVKDTSVELAEQFGVNATTVELIDVNATTVELIDVNATTIELVEQLDVNATSAIQEDEEEIPLMLIIAAVVAAAVIGGAIAYYKSRKSTTEKAPTKKFCGKCGAVIDINYKFCRKCGKPLPKK